MELPDIRKGWLTRISPKAFTLAMFMVLCLGGTKLRAQGPPFQVDDPVPVDFKHYEFYIFGVD